MKRFVQWTGAGILGVAAFFLGCRSYDTGPVESHRATQSVHEDSAGPQEADPNWDSNRDSTGGSGDLGTRCEHDPNSANPCDDVHMLGDQDAPTYEDSADSAPRDAPPVSEEQ
jgi:hypothetical protein